MVLQGFEIVSLASTGPVGALAARAREAVSLLQSKIIEFDRVYLNTHANRNSVWMGFASVLRNATPAIDKVTTQAIEWD